MSKKKAEAMTPKAISNRIKAKGLQKLRWYCEMCQKQCRDENGFKCHTMSESHQRQLLLFAETPDKYIAQYTSEFLKGYTDLLKRQFGCKRVLANAVYQEYIKDRNHVHMNATKWHTLSGLVQWLGREGICKVDETERGWYVQYIERDPEQERKQRGKEKLELTDAELQQKQIDRQIERGRTLAAEAPEPEATSGPTELKRPAEGDGGEIRLNLSLKRAATASVPAGFEPGTALASRAAAGSANTADVGAVFKRPLALEENALVRAEREAKRARMEAAAKKASQQQPQAKSAVELLREELEREKAGRSWLSTGLVVRVIDSTRAELHRRKAIVESVVRGGVGTCAGRLRFLDGDKKYGRAEVPEARLETVLPALGGAVRVVGPSHLHRGCLATLVSLEEADFACTVRLEDGPSAGLVVSQTAYEDVCKVQ